MKTIKIITLVFAFMALSACESDDKIVDPIFEFVAFQDEQVSINEADSSVEPFPIILDFKGYEVQEDIVVNLTFKDNNVTEGVDYTVSSKTLTIKKGEYNTDTLFITTIDNAVGNDERSIEIGIESTTNPEVLIGLGIDNPTHAVLTAIIADDECSETIDIFDGVTLDNVTPWGTYPAASSVNGDKVTVQGDLIAYGSFPNAKLEVTLTPNEPGATKGKVTFDQQVTGTDNDGYVYAFVQVGEGTYDVCSGTIDIEYEVYYESGGAWAYWYSLTNSFKLQ